MPMTVFNQQFNSVFVGKDQFNQQFQNEQVGRICKAFESGESADEIYNLVAGLSAVHKIVEPENGNERTGSSIDS